MPGGQKRSESLRCQRRDIEKATLMQLTKAAQAQKDAPMNLTKAGGSGQKQQTEVQSFIPTILIRRDQVSNYPQSNNTAAVQPSITPIIKQNIPHSFSAAAAQDQQMRREPPTFSTLPMQLAV